MNQYLQPDNWKIIENGFDPNNAEASESLFSIGNGKMGQRANFEEHYSGKSLQGSYIAGVYYPDKTRVGWWKNGYPEYFAKVLNSTNWIGIDISINNTILDLAKAKIEEFSRVLDMKEGHLSRSFIAELSNGNRIKVFVQRFLSIVDDEIGAIKYEITPLNFTGIIEYTPYIDGDIINSDSNYDENFWNELYQKSSAAEAVVGIKTKKTGFTLCTSMRYEFHRNGKKEAVQTELVTKSKYAGNRFQAYAKENETLTLYKYASLVSSFHHKEKELEKIASKNLDIALNKHYNKMLEEQIAAWNKKWEASDIIIEGDEASQQAIRFNIFQLDQTYSGKDDRLNIGPKGFTGEKYGGSTYWDTEAYCLPFYLATAEPQVSKNLLLYRYKQLPQAIENAEKLGFQDGAALFPMVTMNGEECHNEWEITFEEIHRNGAIAWAVYNYILHTGDKEYLIDYGTELLIAISRFWSQRITFSSAINKYVMLGVTGPNEYENNVDNNWYTNTLACWTMEYTIEALNFIKNQNPEKHTQLLSRIDFNEESETLRWKDIIGNMHLPYDKERQVFLQQDNYLNKEQMLAKDLDPKQRPINQHWSWDRILRSCFIKQADTLQGIYLFEDRFDPETIKRNFNFYESRTLHESSLSPCIHSVLAAKIKNMDKAYEMYLRTSRLDLDDYNNEVHEGLHITSMAGTWMAVVQGFGGMRVKKDKVWFNPQLPEKWNAFSFKVRWRGSVLNVTTNKQEVTVENLSNIPATIMLFNKEYTIEGESKQKIDIQ